MERRVTKIPKICTKISILAADQINRALGGTAAQRLPLATRSTETPTCPFPSLIVLFQRGEPKQGGQLGPHGLELNLLASAGVFTAYLALLPLSCQFLLHWQWW